MTAIPFADFRRVVASAALMSSPLDGECLGATRAVCRLLAKHSLEPCGVISRGLSPEPVGPLKTVAPSDERSPAMPRRWAVMPMLPWEVTVKDLLSSPGLLTPWERGFLCDVAKRLDPSRLQLATIDRIAASVAVRRGEGDHAE